MSDCLPTVRWRQTAASHGDGWRQKEEETEKRRKWNNKTGHGQTARRRLPAPIMHQGAERGHAAGRTDRTDSAAVALRHHKRKQHRLKDLTETHQRSSLLLSVDQSERRNASYSSSSS